MNSEGNEIKTFVIELEPGWILVKYADSSCSDELGDSYLQKTIEDWFSMRPRMVIDKTEQVIDGERVKGIHVWFHENEVSDAGNVSDSAEANKSFSINVHQTAASRLPQEHIEALVEAGLKIASSYESPEKTLIVVGTRRVAVVLDSVLKSGSVLPVEFIEQVTHGRAKAKLNAWLQTPATPYYVLHLDGRWPT